MVKNIIVDLETIEGMLYFWQAASEKENVSETFFYDMSDMDGFNLIYDKDFTKESVRKVLSAIKNRELLSGADKKEKRFWNYNMWVMEDLEYTKAMADPVKHLNLDSIIEELNKEVPNGKFEELKVFFVPLHLEDYYIKGNSLIINFFKVKPNDFEDGANIGGVPLEKYVKDKLVELLKK
ncbi:hypothetical protein [Clostridium fallax]|uniref:Uncharacterized protein n=1 Tax=Clostridium fallax TaxID=1533 RepID=A0A1M4W9A8_9CLOT|nr:hypothetical protein [Clostridium fallax]SHE77740.1 hypothetical protein SAMN05443638_11118 [Clostridium fallax]SQB05946.1 Uncharacterised protein [Clostridium fallax]